MSGSAGNHFAAYDEDDEFCWLDVDDCEDEEDDDSYAARYLQGQQTPNPRLFGGHPNEVEIKRFATPAECNPDHIQRLDCPADAGPKKKKVSSFLPTFADDEDEEKCNDDDESIGFLVSTTSDPAREEPQPPLPSEQDPDVQTARAVVDELSRLLGGAAPLDRQRSHDPPQAKPEDAGECDLPCSPNSVMSWFPQIGSKVRADNEPGSSSENQGAVPSPGRPKRSASLDPAAMSHAAGSAVSVAVTGSVPAAVVAPPQTPETRQFTRLAASDRTRSMPARLVPLTAKPRKSALKRTSSICQSQTSVSTGGSVASTGADAAPPAANDGWAPSLSPSAGRTSSTSSLKRNVSFTNLEIREYSIALSDHPGCSYGPPIQLGWEYRDQKAVDVEEYEQRRPPRRPASELVMSYNVRRYLLLKRAGYSKPELQAAMKEVERVKRDRMVTDLLLPASKIDETLEEIIQSFREVLFPPPKRRGRDPSGESSFAQPVLSVDAASAGR
jgi:hypothetical protein